MSTWVVLAVVLLALVLLAPRVEAQPIKQWKITVEEAHGIKRGGYLVTVGVPLGAVYKDAAHFHLLENGKPIAVQLTPNGHPEKGFKHVSLDFQSSHAPFQSREYTFVHDPQMKPLPPAKGGISIEEEDGFYHVTGGGMTYIVPQSLKGLLRHVKSGKEAFLHQDSPGLQLGVRRDTELKYHALSGTSYKSRITKNGPFTAALRFEGEEIIEGKALPSTITLEFPRSRSWVRVRWELDDAHRLLSALQLTLHLRLEGTPVFADFGASSFVYTQLKKDEIAELSAGSPLGFQTMRSWEVHVGKAGKLLPYVLGPRLGDGQVSTAEGWAHLMDRQRCTAAGLVGFGGTERLSTIACAADGRLSLAHTNLPADQRHKVLACALHFVAAPPHLGAVTSPQSMLFPPRVTVSD